MSKQKVAVIGSGISGLSASFFLSKKFEVHLFEKNDLIGGHTRTISFKDNKKNSISIDTGFIVFNDDTYPDLVSFFNLLGVKIEDSDMSFSVACELPYLEYGGSNLNSLFAQRKIFFLLNLFHYYLKLKNFIKYVNI